jgi:hypothetical protein
MAQDTQQEKVELEAILGSKLFARAPSLAKLLSYICGKYFDGEVDQIKEYTIAVELFKREPDFHSKEDPIVRVEANRLRARLKEYYRTEGKDHPVQIFIPSGQYAPVFQYKQTSRAPGAADEKVGKTKGSDDVIPEPNGSRVPLLDDGTPDGDKPPLRIMAGSSLTKYVDRFNKVWVGDCYFSGGEVLAASPTALLRAEKSHLCKLARQGDFEYDIPLKPGIHELHLHFAEMQFGFEPEEGGEEGGETSRIFNVFANERPILEAFDVFSDAAGCGKMDEKVFTDISPAQDGRLHLSFHALKNKPIVNGLEILPGIAGRMRPVRITTRTSGYLSSDQQLWEPDRYFQGGRNVVRLHPVEGTRDPELYQSERYGNFTYTIPVAHGRYRLTLKFTETYFGPTNPAGVGSGMRLFDVYCNGQTLLKDFDIAREAGGVSRSLDKVLHGLQPNAQGKLVLAFVPVKNYACVNAIEIVPE